jgi:hypothetical protein
MRKSDKKHNMSKVNLLTEQRYLQSKGLISESFHSPKPVNNVNKEGLGAIKNEITDLNPNFTINYDALKVMSLDLEITYDSNTKLYKVRNSSNGKYYTNNIFHTQCVNCEFQTPDDVIKFIRRKAQGGSVQFMPESKNSIDEMDYSREIEIDDFKFLNNPEFDGWEAEKTDDSVFSIKNDNYPYFEFVVSLNKSRLNHTGEYPWYYEAKHIGGKGYLSSGHQGFYTIERNATSNLEKAFKNFLRNKKDEMR